MAMNLVKLPTGKPNLQLRVSKGHYATSHSHINYYIDVTLTKFRLSEARAAAQELVRSYRGTTIISFTPERIHPDFGIRTFLACLDCIFQQVYQHLFNHGTIRINTQVYRPDRERERNSTGRIQPP